MNFETIDRQEGDKYSRHIKHISEKADMPITREELENLCQEDELLESLYHHMLRYCWRYMHDVFQMMEFEETNSRDEDWRVEYERLDAARTDLHNATCNHRQH